jgi:hypothetical protein
VYVRAANGPTSRWYRAAISQRAGRVRMDDHNIDVTFAPAPPAVALDIDAAYEVKYRSSSVVAIMQGDGPTAAIVVIAPR